MLLQIGFFCLVLGIGMFLNSLIRKKTFRLLNNEEKEKYQFIAHKPIYARTQEEQNFYLQTQESYWSLKIASVSFNLSLILICLGVFFKYIIK